MRPSLFGLALSPWRRIGFVDKRFEQAAVTLVRAIATHALKKHVLFRCYISIVNMSIFENALGAPAIMAVLVDLLLEIAAFTICIPIRGLPR